ncbi:DUF368 domain-containing protein [Microbacterium koreense]|uniref:DUF368 domain-containing protein n=1 Tax=Microbacterium koreense TaxID=323761 RepID=A0ABW2ZPJ8_9MICO
MPPHSPDDAPPSSDVPPLPSDTPPPDHRFRLGHAILNILRGAVIGMAELVPGISGGTVALITGVYERLIDGASHVVSAAKRLIVGPDRLRSAGAEIARVDWWLVVPVLIGMLGIVLTLAGTIEHLVTSNAEASRGLFFGLVAASIAVPLRLVPKARRTIGSRFGGGLIFVGSAVVAFVLIGFAGGAVAWDPPLWVVGLAAVVAVCALVVPGLSGSFFLLAIGLYSPTLRAIDERDFVYLGVFTLGAAIGLVSIVRVMKWLLDRHRRITLLAMAGLMLGSLRALWPWQNSIGSEEGAGSLAAPFDPVVLPIVLAVVGAAAVVALLVVEHHIQRRTSATTRVPSLDIE